VRELSGLETRQATKDIDPMKDPFRESTLPGFVILFIGANMIAALAAIVAAFLGLEFQF